RLDLGALTVVVGPNASGKTALADAVCIDAVGTADRWRGKAATELVCHRDGEVLARSENAFSHWGRRQKVVLYPDAIRSAQTAQEHFALQSDGSNLANLFDTLSRDDQASFVADFVRLVPVFRDLKARASAGKKRLLFEDRWEPGLWYEPHQVSDGSMLAAGFVALAYQRDVPDLVVIEDPDRGLHPYLQRQVVELLRALTRGEIGATPFQIVCTTHSKAFLDHLEPGEVRFLSRSAETGETVLRTAPVDNPRWRELYEQRFDGSLGDLWLTGALGGVPGT
ncbi:MAG: AAA family ATPase, partial [Myxococcales bacterium]|nr:AAA family ATPase [Myxococcales bacterium]